MKKINKDVIRSKTMNLNIKVNTKLDALSGKVLFREQLEKANAILAKMSPSN